MCSVKCFLFIGDANGWKPEDMFAINEREYGVQSTYKSNLEGYTIQLDSNRNSDEYRYCTVHSTVNGSMCQIPCST